MTHILGIESSCDETAAAVVADGRQILSSVVASQLDVHRKYGGVVPELASREHLRQIVPVVREALEQAGLSLNDLDAVAVTRGPGLIGSLLVGVTYGKVLAMSAGKPLIPVNHLEGHVHAVLLEAHREAREPALPAVCLIVSGGHTILYEVSAANIDAHAVSPAAFVPSAVEGHRQSRSEAFPVQVQFSYRRIGQTRDDAAGEAYDKVAKLLAFGYPGGPVIDHLAIGAGKDAIALARDIRFDRTKMKGNPYDFSFSGLKTAVLYYVRAHPELAPEIAARERALREGRRKVAELLPLCTPQTLALMVSFQNAVVEELVSRALVAAEEFSARSILVSGGVAANSQLRRTFEEAAGKRGLDVFFPSRALSTDNAAMIAAAAYPRFLAGERASLDLTAEASLPLA